MARPEFNGGRYLDSAAIIAIGGRYGTKGLSARIQAARLRVGRGWSQGGRVSDLKTAFAGDAASIRNAMKELLRGRRMTVGPDPERGFKVEGLFEWALETKDARSRGGGDRANESVVAGTRYQSSL